MRAWAAPRLELGPVDRLVCPWQTDEDAAAAPWALGWDLDACAPFPAPPRQSAARSSSVDLSHYW